MLTVNLASCWQSCRMPSYRGYRFSPEIISHAVWLYYRFALSFRDVEDVLAGVVARRPCGGGAVWPALLVTLRRSHTTGMKSKVHPTYTTKYRVANWPAYNRALVRRGDVPWCTTPLRAESLP